MKPLLLLLGTLCLLLNACVGTTPLPRVIDGHTYLDESPPVTNITFPFEVEFLDRDVRRDGYLKTEKVSLKSKEKSLFITIHKKTLRHTHYFFTETDRKYLDRSIYEDVKPNGFCSVGLEEEKLTNYLVGVVMSFEGTWAKKDMQIYKRLGYISSKEEYIKNNSNYIEEFKSYIQDICRQEFEKK